MATNDYHELVFSRFNYYIVAMFCEYLNDVSQHSYDDLTDDWWRELFSELNIVDTLADCDTSDTEKKILDRVLTKLPDNFLTDEQTNEMSKYLKEEYVKFILSVFSPSN